MISASAVPRRGHEKSGSSVGQRGFPPSCIFPPPPPPPRATIPWSPASCNTHGAQLGDASARSSESLRLSSVHIQARAKAIKQSTQAREWRHQNPIPVLHLPPPHPPSPHLISHFIPKLTECGLVPSNSFTLLESKTLTFQYVFSMCVCVCVCVCITPE